LEGSGLKEKIMWDSDETEAYLDDSFQTSIQGIDLSEYLFERLGPYGDVSDMVGLILEPGKRFLSQPVVKVSFAFSSRRLLLFKLLGSAATQIC
jgi:hypothetical protein